MDPGPKVKGQTKNLIRETNFPKIKNIYAKFHKNTITNTKVIALESGRKEKWSETKSSWERTILCARAQSKKCDDNDCFQSLFST